MTGTGTSLVYILKN